MAAQRPLSRVPMEMLETLGAWKRWLRCRPRDDVQLPSGVDIEIKLLECLGEMTLRCVRRQANLRPLLGKQMLYR